MAPRSASPLPLSPLGRRAAERDAGGEASWVRSVDVERVWLAQHLASSDMGPDGRSYDSFADLCGLVPSTPRASASGGAPAPAPLPVGAASPPAEEGGGGASPARSPSRGGADEGGTAAAERWRRRMKMSRSASTDALDAWSATLGEAVAGVAISNADDEAHTLIRRVARGPGRAGPPESASQSAF